MSRKIESIEQALAYLSDVRGNVAEIISDGVIAFLMGQRTVIVTMDEGFITISCEVEKFDSAADPEELLKKTLLLLKQNIATLPYAYALVPEENGEAASIVLVDSIPVGDLCEDEIGFALDTLRVALQAHDQIFNQ